MKKSFTLIELAVVIGITLLLVTGVVTGLSAGRQGREVKTTAERVRTMILEARSRAMNPDENAKGLLRVEVRVDKASPNKVKIVERYDARADVPEITIQEYIPPKSVKIEPDAASFNSNSTLYYFSFDALNTLTLGQAIFKTATPSIIQANINIFDGTSKYQLTIYKTTGNVEIKAID